jgi:hypothetical protein
MVDETDKRHRDRYVCAFEGRYDDETLKRYDISEHRL